MGLLSFLRKNQQESDPDDSGFYSRAEEASDAGRVRGRKKQAAATAQAVDPVLPEKKRARRRLIGAIALVLVLIIGLPMVLDAEPKSVADDITIQIPSKDLPENRSSPRRPSSSTQVLPPGIDSGEEVIDLPIPGKRPSLNATVTPDMPVSSSELSKVREERKPNIDRVSLNEEAAPKSSANPIEEQKKPTLVKSVSTKAVASSNELEQPLSTSATKSTSGKQIDDRKASGSEKKNEKIVIQIAALATTQKVSELQGKLLNAGIRSYTQKVSTESGERIRVRTGPYDKDAADRIKAKLTGLGLRGTVVSN